LIQDQGKHWDLYFREKEKEKERTTQLEREERELQ